VQQLSTTAEPAMSAPARSLLWHFSARMGCGTLRSISRTTSRRRPEALTAEPHAACVLVHSRRPRGHVPQGGRDCHSGRTSGVIPMFRLAGSGPVARNGSWGRQASVDVVKAVPEARASDGREVDRALMALIQPWVDCGFG